MDSNKRIGIFGGTFDPVHFGHLRPAVEIAELYNLKTLFVMPSHRPAHRGPTGASSKQRIAMLSLAVGRVPRLVVDAREALRDESTYTFDTLSEIKKEQPDATILFFLGMDSFAAFDTWQNWEGILELANLVVLNRPGAVHSNFSLQLLDRQLSANGAEILNGGTGVVQSCDVTQLAISATDVRRRIANHLSVRFLLPDAVTEYISENDLYRR
ncbi:MAG: nicotinate-nucleotide adenylyltransferase [Granulosicoccus sp.]